jgi:hypothetical protein
MPTLHIEHAVTSFSEWKSAFDRYAEFRERSGVRRHSILRPVDDAHYVMIDLDFDTTEQAQGFLATLREKICHHRTHPLSWAPPRPGSWKPLWQRGPRSALSPRREPDSGRAGWRQCRPGTVSPDRRSPDGGRTRGPAG